MEREKYMSWSVTQLKRELLRRGASTRGRKVDLVERLLAYDRNRNFVGESIITPSSLEVTWPTKGFQQLTEAHRPNIPPICLEQIDLYFIHRLAGDKQSSGDLKAIEKGRLLLQSNRILAVSVLSQDNCMYLSGIVGAAMKNKVSYNFKIKLEMVTADILNTHCECPAGCGPHGTCKHIAAVLIMLCLFVSGDQLYIQKSCTENLQTFHRPKHNYKGSPVKAECLLKKKKSEDMFEDPRPLKYRNNAGFPDRTRNMVLNYCAMTSENLTYRYLHPKADIQTATKDHDYLERPFTEYWVDEALQVTERYVKEIEESTRGQSDNRQWFNERQWRMTASRFGDICLATEKRDKLKLCKSLVQSSDFHSDALAHGKAYEAKAIKKFEERMQMKVQPSGLFVCMDRPYLGASPDGLVGEDGIVEVKCPYNGRHENIVPGEHFSFLCYENDQVVLKQNSKYYFQIQGQLYVSKRKFCYFVVFTFKDLFIQYIQFCEDYCEGSLLPKLDLFFVKHFRPFLSSTL